VRHTPGMVRLVPMNEADFEPYLDRLIGEYAADHIRAGRWTAAEGLAEARKEVGKLLPSGRESPNQYIFSIVAGAPESKVGVLWLASEPRGGFVYDLRVFEPFRRHGYAEEAMRLAEEVARSKGLDKISLHVFGDNVSARRLYTRLGYAETHVIMSKSLAR
jgi:ribosomal protein S18 acetylase RimI-like enzyme